MGNIVRLPNYGRVIVASDLHGSSSDLFCVYEIFYEMGRNSYLVLAGDSINLGDIYGNNADIMSKINELKKAYPERVFILAGNHELHEIVTGQCSREFAANLSLVALCENDVAIAHAHPTETAISQACIDSIRLEEMTYRQYKTGELYNFLNESGLVARPDRDNDKIAKKYLSFFGPEFNVCVRGHDYVKGWKKSGRHIITIASGEQLLIDNDNEKTFLELDLSKKYASVDDFKVGREIRSLYE